MENFKTNDEITIKIINLSDENIWADSQRYEVHMNHRDYSGSNIDGTLMILDKKEDIMRTITDFLNIKYNKL